MAVWRQPRKAERIELRKFRRVFRTCETPLWHTSAISQLQNGLQNGHKITLLPRDHLQATNQVANHLQVAESSPSWKTKVQTCKMDNSTCESMCAIHLCNLRYLPLTKLDFFSQYILCKFLFSPYNQSKILLGYFLENIFSIYIFEPM